MFSVSRPELFPLLSRHVSSLSLPPVVLPSSPFLSISLFCLDRPLLDQRAQTAVLLQRRPETPTHPLVACESATRWDGGNGISLLTRDCCRRRPPCFLLLLRFFLLLFLASPLASPSLLPLSPLPRRRPVRWNSPKFFVPANKHHPTMEDGPTRKPRPINSLGLSFPRYLFL